MYALICRVLLLILLSPFIQAHVFAASGLGSGLALAGAAEDGRVPILLYHRFGPTVADGMTIKTQVFAEHLRYLQENGYTVIPLRRLVDYLAGRATAPGPKSVVIVEDDAHKSVYSDMLPLVKKYRVPVTVFVYPSAISNASYAMTWDQLRELKKTGLFDIQSHTFWHPNFKREKRKLSAAQYARLVDTQLRKAKSRLEKELGGTVDYLAWPFGIYDAELERMAGAAGYVAAFTIERRHAAKGDRLLAIPRYLLVNADQGASFRQLLEGRAVQRNIVY